MTDTSPVAAPAAPNGYLADADGNRSSKRAAALIALLCYAVFGGLAMFVLPLKSSEAFAMWFLGGLASIGLWGIGCALAERWAPK